MKKILTFLSVLLFVNVFTLDFANTAWENDSKTKNKVAMGGLVPYGFKLTLRYDDEYTAGTTNNVTYRQSYINVDKSSPSVSSASSSTKIYDGFQLSQLRKHECKEKHREVNKYKWCCY